jgi:glycerophosphoryl diester phosphodiesterase
VGFSADEGLPSLRPAGPRAADAILRVAHRTVERIDAEQVPSVVASAKTRGAHLLEFDVRTTADGRPIVYHDSVIGALNAEPRWVLDLPLAALWKLSPNIIEVEKVIEAAANARLGVYIDIKSLTRQSGELLRTAIRATGISSRCILASRRTKLLMLCADLAPDIPRSVLFTSAHEDPVDLASGSGASFVHPCWEKRDRPDTLLTNRWLRRVWERGLGVVSWHEERGPVIEGLYQRGVDAICSDEPELLQTEALRVRSTDR